MQRLYSLYSDFEIGDVFCLAYSSVTQTIFCGAQNSSIQWHKLAANAVADDVVDITASRKHRFFDSLGPGGIPSPAQQQNGSSSNAGHGGQSVTLAANNYVAYAHKSYIYTMLLAKGLVEGDPDQELLVTADGGGTVKVWSIKRLQKDGLRLVCKLKNKGTSILSLTYKAPFLYAGLSDSTVVIYNLESQQVVHKLKVGDATECGDITQIQLLDGLTFCGTSTGWIKVTDTRLAEVSRWHAHRGKILASATSDTSGRKLWITGGNDNTIAFWQSASVNITEGAGLNTNNELLASLKQFVSYRTVAKNPSCASDCHEAVTFLRKLCNYYGATTALITPEEGVNPILVAKFRASEGTASRKTVLFYGHYDVVDAQLSGDDDRLRWHADPFKLHPLNGFLYGRGVTDNKGPILAALYAVAELTQNDALGCNIIFLLEGDEEAGSRGFRQAVREHKAEIGPVDYVLLSNSYWLDDHIPCLTFGMRGVVHVQLSVSSNKPDLHSGMDGKSMQHEPLKDLTVLLASLIGPSGTEVLIPDFQETIDPLQQSELRAYKSIATALMAGHPEIKNEDAFTRSLMQRWRDPNLTVHSVTVPESKTAVTISHRANATLSIRIVPSQKADEVATNLEDYLRDQFEALQSRNNFEVTITSKADPWLGRVHSEIYEELREAIIEAWSYDESSSRSFAISNESQTSTPSLPRTKPTTRRLSVLASAGTFTSGSTPHEPLFIREGGSIPAISFLEKEFEAPAAMFPMGQASDNAHLDNERMRVENLYKGRDVLRMLFSRLGTSPERRLRARASSLTI